MDTEMEKQGMEAERIKIYLGDGLYVSYDGYQINLSANDGYRDTNTVYLDPSVLNSFIRYLEKIFQIKVVSINNKDL